MSYVELAMRSKGHLDIYFGPFLINEFPFTDLTVIADLFKIPEEEVSFLFWDPIFRILLVAFLP